MKAALARAAYSTLLRLATPAYLLRLWWRGRLEPPYRERLAERLGFQAPADAPGRLWVHAVSLGETRAAAALVAELRWQQPQLRLLLTHGTATGFAAGTALLRPGDAQVWMPYDTPGAVRRFLAAHRPAAGVLMETEIWPNLLHEARRAGLPLVLANARLSERSARKGERLAALMRPAAACLSEALAQTEADAERLRAAGVREVRVMGNLKFDITPAPALLAEGQAWRASLSRPVVALAVSREGEEAPLLAAWCDLPAPRPLLLIVPRHPQRFDEVAALVAERGLVLKRRSTCGPTIGGTPVAASRAEALAALARADVWLGDSIGEMPFYYGVAHVALLGGSFAPLGGQNLIEAAACGCPLLMGPHTFNFAEAAELALAAGAAERVPSLELAVPKALAWLGLSAVPEPSFGGGSASNTLSGHPLAERSRRGAEFAALHRGAAARMAGAVLSHLGAPAGARQLQ